MSLDYKQLGLKIGLEIHQQLSGKKLFCNCPAEINDNPSDITLERTLRAVAGEQGTVDVAAVHETKRQRTFFYQVHHDNACLVETDEEPPHDMNQESLHVALITAKLLQANIVNEIQVMRKTVVDGSNTTGFQRTALVALHGKLFSNNHLITIPTICIEEDSCKIVEKRDDAVVYNLSRLGIPLVEIATGPDIHLPEQAKEVAEKLGMILRSTGKVKRGLGTIRQDLNVSITGGTRVEIKGCQDLHLIPLLVENEVLRQQHMLVFKEKTNGFKPLKETPQDLASIFKNTACNFLKNALKKGNVIYGMRVPNFLGLFGYELMPNHRIGTEISDIVKIVTGAGIVHSDELPTFGISQAEIDDVRQLLSCQKNDAFVLSTSSKDGILHVFEVITSVIHQLDEGVISHVRMAKEDGTTKYLRPMPGAARMYPETDIIPLVPDVKHIVLPELIEDKIVRYEQHIGLSKDLSTAMAKHEHMPFFEQIITKHKKLKPAFVAETLVSYEPEILRNYKDKNPNTSLITHTVLDEVFVALTHEKIVKEHVLQALLNVSLGKPFNVSDYMLVDHKALEAVVKQVIHEHPGAAFGLLMGRCMAALQGKADGRIVSELLKKYMK